MKKVKLGHKLTGILAGCSLLAVAALPGAATAATNVPDLTANDHSIVITKLEGPDNGAAGTGGDYTVPADKRKVKDVPFKVSKLNIDLTKSENWKKWTVEEAQAKGVASVVGTQGTDVNGQTTFANLAAGVYLVEEQDATTPTANGDKTKVTKKSNPFLVFLPLNVNNTWTKVAKVYPKNELADEPTKTLDDSAVFFTDNAMVWTITYRLPQPVKAGATLEKFKVLDDFDARLENIQLVSVQVNGATKTGEFTMSGDTNNKTISANTPATLRGGDKIIVKVSATLQADATVTTAVPNTAKFEYKYTNENDKTPDDNTPASTPETEKAKWAKIVLTKKDAAEATKKLSGGVFYLCNASKAAFTAPNYEASTGCKLMTDNGDGTYSLLVRVAEGYVVYEKTAPAGYKLKENADENKVEVTFTEEELKEDGMPVADKAVELTNEKFTATDLPALPLTGAAGQLLLTIAGVSVLALAAGSMLVAYKRRK